MQLELEGSGVTPRSAISGRLGSQNIIGGWTPTPLGKSESCLVVVNITENKKMFNTWWCCWVLFEVVLVTATK